MQSYQIGNYKYYISNKMVEIFPKFTLHKPSFLKCKKIESFK